MVFDPVGGAVAESAVRAVAWGGRYLVVGFASGGIPRVGLNIPAGQGRLGGQVFWGSSSGATGGPGRDRRQCRPVPSDPLPCSGSRRRATSSAFTSTQENAWLVLAARALARDATSLSLDVNGEAIKTVLYRGYKPADTDAAGPHHQHRRGAASGRSR